VSDEERREGADGPEREDGVEPVDGADDSPDETGHEPATWAGRQGWSGPADEPGEAGHAGEHELPPEAAGGEAPEPAEAEGEEESAEAGRETVEADTLALADSEEAREAALAGLRARTAEHAAKRGITDPGPAPAPPVAEPADEAEAEAGEAAEEPTAVGVEAAAGPSGDEASPEEEKPPRAGVWARFLAASFLIVASMASATAISLLVYLTDIAKGLGGLEGVQGQLAEVEGGKPQNFLILGSDVRPDEAGKGRSDTTMLLRVDPEKDVISQLSIPRDLEVNIPGHGVDKFNTAYFYGGPKLTTQVVRQSILGPKVPIHHVVNIDFNGFADAVDAIDCVYIDVDRHYFNDNATAVSFEEQYAEIDIEAGYQRLCGFKALQYVRYRHEDNDIVRGARQQTFLREARQKVPPSKLLDDRNELIDIFKSYTTSDIDDVATLVQLFKLMLGARNAQINQIEFPFDSLDEQGYVTVNDGPLKEAINEFLGVGLPDVPQPDEGGGDGGGEKPDAEKPKPKPKPDDEVDTDPIEAAAARMLDSTPSGQQYAALIRDQAAQIHDEKKFDFPLLYPTRILASSSITDDTRFFRIDGPGKEVYRGYKFVMSMPGTTYPTSYYGVSGTDWIDAPLFNNASEEREIGGRTYKLYFDSGRLRMVAFQKDGGMYWVTNTLDKLLDEAQMLAIAQNLAVAGG
jgi:polyisoprenyl-teichoic acid--peptidoglycan teichoic acid transferase